MKTDTRLDLLLVFCRSINVGKTYLDVLENALLCGESRSLAFAVALQLLRSMALFISVALSKLICLIWRKNRLHLKFDFMKSIQSIRF